MSDSNGLKEKGNEAFAAGDYPNAIKFYTEAIEKDSGNHVLYSNRSAAYAKANQFAESLKDAEQILTINPTWTKGFSRKSAALMGLQRFEDAYEVCMEGLKLEPQNEGLEQASEEAKQALMEKFLTRVRQKPTPMDQDPYAPSSNASASTFSANSKTPPPAADPDADLPENKRAAKREKLLGNEFYKKKNFSDAITHYTKAIEHDSTDITIYSNMAAVYFEQKEFEKCIAECEKGVIIGRENRADYKLIAKAFTRIGNAYKKLENWEMAKTHFEKALSEHRTPEVNVLLCEADKIIKENKRREYIDPVKAEEEKEKGNHFFKTGEFQTAVKHYTEAIKRNPDDPKLYSNRAACYTKLAAFDLGLKDCDKCIELDKSFLKAYLRKGKILQGMQQHSKAQGVYQRALEIDPSNAEALDGYRSCTMGTPNNSEKAVHQAMSDPEIQAILKDPAMRIILQQMSNDPKAVFDHLQNPEIAHKIQKLVENGIVQIK